MDAATAGGGASRGRRLLEVNGSDGHHGGAAHGQVQGAQIDADHVLSKEATDSMELFDDVDDEAHFKYKKMLELQERQNGGVGTARGARHGSKPRIGLPVVSTMPPCT